MEATSTPRGICIDGGGGATGGGRGMAKRSRRTAQGAMVLLRCGLAAPDLVMVVAGAHRGEREIHAAAGDNGERQIARHLEHRGEGEMQVVWLVWAFSILCVLCPWRVPCVLGGAIFNRIDRSVVAGSFSCVVRRGDGVRLVSELDDSLHRLGDHRALNLDTGLVSPRWPRPHTKNSVTHTAIWLIVFHFRG